MSEPKTLEERQAEWERIRPTLPPKQLDSKQRCCGRKPISYKRPSPHLFCTRCSASFDPATKRQIENWGYMASGDGFVMKYRSMA